MLTTLRIKNLALVSDLTLELRPGFNAITGETGAGKSIIIGALNLVLGERADRTLIRSGTDNCSVEAVFDISSLAATLKTFLDESGLEACEDNQLVLKRSFSTSGTNRQFVNGSPTTMAALTLIGESLVDMHGPHDHQSLLHPAKQLMILDAFGGLSPLRENFASVLARRTALQGEKASLIVDEKTYAQQLDLLRFQVSEISSAKFRADEEAEVEQEYQRSSNAAKLLEHCQTALGLLSEDDNALISQAGMMGRSIQELQRLDESAGCLATLHGQCLDLLRELQNELSHYSDRVEINPERLRALEERLNLIHSLKRKYGASLLEVITFGDDAEKKLRTLEERDAELERINGELKKLDAELSEAGERLSTARRKVIPKLAKAAMKQLSDLGFKQSEFQIALETLKRDSALPLSSSGFDKAEFLFSPNAGEPTRPLRSIASSGEMARVMLALKTVLAAQDEIPVLIFDEVDANVGGETANAVGEKMLQIGRQRQVLCITHLPQVAACSSAHFTVKKQLKDGRTISEITLLNDSERVDEVARMLGGQSEAARKHARALLKAASAQSKNN
ncbi:MAG: repair protein RecN [Verrucomicrobiales bacterium]|nr:repair protein RecN [Verrucomicrobiales bacterium]